MPNVKIVFEAQDAAPLRARRIDARGLTTAQRAALDASANDAAFFSSKVSDAKLLEDMRDYLAEAAEGVSGRTRGDFITRFAKRLGGGFERWDSRGALTDISSSRRLGLIFDFQLERLDAEAQAAQADDAEYRAAFPAQELVRLERRRVPRDWRARWKEAGGRLRGGRMVALRDDPIWTRISRFGSAIPPFDFNSGMGLRDVSADEATALGLRPEAERSAAA